MQPPTTPTTQHHICRARPLMPNIRKGAHQPSPAVLRPRTSARPPRHRTGTNMHPCLHASHCQSLPATLPPPALPG
eukprot:12046748-Alexandrium_andersonii.AAC.1